MGLPQELPSAHKKSGRRISTAPALFGLFLSKGLEESLETFN
jgi:hypothetical protein